MNEIITTTTSTSSDTFNAIRWQISIATMLLNELRRDYFTAQRPDQRPTTEQIQKLGVEYRNITMKLDAIDTALGAAWETMQD